MMPVDIGELFRAEGLHPQRMTLQPWATHRETRKHSKGVFLKLVLSLSLPLGVYTMHTSLDVSLDSTKILQTDPVVTSDSNLVTKTGLDKVKNKCELPASLTRSADQKVSSYVHPCLNKQMNLMMFVNQ